MRHSEVANTGAAPLIEEDIGGFHVAVQNPDTVNGTQRSEHRHRNLHGAFRGNCLGALQHLFEDPPRHPIHRRRRRGPPK